MLDLAVPKHESLVDYRPGLILPEYDVAAALEGVDTFVNLVMRSPQGGSVTDQDLTIIKNNYEVNTLGLHYLLCIPHRGWASRPACIPRR